MKVLPTICVTFIIMFQHVDNTYCFNMRYFNQINKRLDSDFHSIRNALKFLQHNYKQFNVDGLMGVVLAEAKLSSLYDHLWNLPANFAKPELLQIQRLTRSVGWLLRETKIIRQKMAQNFSKEPNASYYNKFRKILNSSLWSKSITRARNMYKHYKPIMHKAYSNIAVIQEIQQSKHAVYNVSLHSPHENMVVSSDECMDELFSITDYKGTVPTLALLKSTLSARCRQAMFSRSVIGAQHGYPLSHRCLFFQIAARLTSLNSTDNGYEKQVTKLCHLMLNDVATVMSASKQKACQQNDLVLEDVVLCSIDEIYDSCFANQWQSQILKMQTKHGCFSIATPTACFSQKNISQLAAGKSTRSIKFLGHADEYCTDHTTGLGLAAVASHANYLTYQTFHSALGVNLRNNPLCA